MPVLLLGNDAIHLCNNVDEYNRVLEDVFANISHISKETPS